MQKNPMFNHICYRLLSEKLQPATKLQSNM